MDSLDRPTSSHRTVACYSRQARPCVHESGLWGYLVPLQTFGTPITLKKKEGGIPSKREKNQKLDNSTRHALGGYLIGRHEECDVVLDGPTISNRHCFLFTENHTSGSVAMVEGLSRNGTQVNKVLLKCNDKTHLMDGDTISVNADNRFIFRYPLCRDQIAFSEQYKLGREIGAGRYASVHTCTEKHSGTQYAVKLYSHKGTTSEQRSIAELHQEIAVLASIDHPSLLTLKDSFHEVNTMCIVMELAVDGELFGYIVERKRLSDAETRHIFSQLFNGIQYLHDRNIVHCDIKPENILVVNSQGPQVKIADFGLAKTIQSNYSTTRRYGTLSYSAPKILKNPSGEPLRNYSRAVDIWSLGVVLYICFCGFPPFSDQLYSKQRPYNLCQQIQRGIFDFPAPHWDNVPLEALELIDHMLTVEIRRRASIDTCLEHTWTHGSVRRATITGKAQDKGIDSSTRVRELDLKDYTNRRQPRERTLLAESTDSISSDWP